MQSIPCDSRVKALCEARLRPSNDYRGDRRAGVRY